MNRFALVVVLLVFVVAAPAGAATTSVVIGAPQVGVAGDGSAVVAWSGPSSVFASIRASGGRFGTGRQLGSGTTARDPSLAVNHRGEALVAWHRVDERTRRPKGAVFASRRAAGRAFGPSVAVPGSAHGFAPSTSVSDSGVAAIALLRTVSRSCGPAVLVAVASPKGSFRRARRISSRCAHATDVHVVLWSGGDGVVTWRSGRALRAVTLDDGRVDRRLLITAGPIATVGYDLTPGLSGAAVVWRAGAQGAVVVAGIDGGGVGEVQRVSAVGARIAGVPQVAIGRDGAAVAAWQEGSLRYRVVAATRAAKAPEFASPVEADACGAVDASRTYASPVIAESRPSIAFQTACAGRFGLGPDFGIALTTRRDDGTWTTQALSGGRYGSGVAVGASDAGDIVAAWKESGSDGSPALRTAVVTG